MFHATSAPRIFGLQSLSHSASRCASRRPLPSCRFSQRRSCRASSTMTLAPAIKLQPTNQTLAWSASKTLALHPEHNPRHQLESCSTEVPRISSERPGTANGADAGRTLWSVQIRKRSVEAASRRPRPTTSGRCSDRASVPRHTSLEAHPSRCSLDLFPSKAIQHCRWAEALPSCTCPTQPTTARKP